MSAFQKRLQEELDKKQALKELEEQRNFVPRIQDESIDTFSKTDPYKNMEIL